MRHGMDAINVQNQGNHAITENGSAGDAFHSAVVGLEAFDDNLLLADQLVDDETNRAACASMPGDRDGKLSARPPG